MEDWVLQVEFKQKEMERKQGISGAEPARAEFRGTEGCAIGKCRMDKAWQETFV